MPWRRAGAARWPAAGAPHADGGGGDAAAAADERAARRWLRLTDGSEAYTTPGGVSAIRNAAPRAPAVDRLGAASFARRLARGAALADGGTALAVVDEELGGRPPPAVPAAPLAPMLVLDGLVAAVGRLPPGVDGGGNVAIYVAATCDLCLDAAMETPVAHRSAAGAVGGGGGGRPRSRAGRRRRRRRDGRRGNARGGRPRRPRRPAAGANGRGRRQGAE